ncbi:MAG: hypothetical protein ACREX8_03285, partial [Gammaproteobacteria bacterium]
MGVAAGQRLRASQYNADLDRTRKKYQTADQIRNNNTAFLASPDLVFSVEANAFYAFDSCILYDTNSTADFKHEYLLPAGSGILVATWTSTLAGALVDSPVAHDALTSFSFGSGGVALGTIMCCAPRGIIAIGGTAGNLVIRFAQNTAAAID